MLPVASPSANPARGGREGGGSPSSIGKTSSMAAAPFGSEVKGRPTVRAALARGFRLGSKQRLA